MAAAKSYDRLSTAVPSLRLMSLCESKTVSFLKPLADHHGVDFSNLSKPMQPDNNISLALLFAALPIASYLEMRQRGFDVSAVRYEDLVARPLDMCRAVLEFCHLPVSLAELAVKAFDMDSQTNSSFAKSAIRHFKEQELTPQTKTTLNEMLKKLGLPLIGEPCIVEGTLSSC